MKNVKQKTVTRMYGIAEFDDGMMQILIQNEAGEIFAETPEFPRHELNDYLHLFLDSELVNNSIENTKPMFELIEGGKNDL